MDFRGSALNAVGGIGIGVVLDYADKATEPMKKTQEQTDKTKKSFADMGMQADKTAAKVNALAEAHNKLTSSIIKIGVIAGTTSYALGAVANRLSGMFDGAIAGAGRFQTQLIATQIEIGDTSKKTYSSMSSLAVQMAAMYNVNAVETGQMFAQLGGAFKTYGGIAALAPTVGRLVDSSNGQLDANAASRLMTEWLFKFHPQEATEGGSTKESSATLAKLSNSELGLMNTLYVGSRMRFDQMDQFLRGVGPAAMSLQGRGVKSATAETELGALGMMTINRAGQTPDYAGQMAGWAARIFSPQQAMHFQQQYGIQTTDSHNIPRSLEDVLFGKKNSFAASSQFQRYQKHELGPMELERLEGSLGGDYVGQIFKLLLAPGGKEEFIRNAKALKNGLEHPDKINNQVRELNQQGFEYQSRQWESNIGALQLLYANNVVPELAKGLRQVNFYLSQFVLFMNNHPEIVKFTTQIVLMAGGIATLGLAFKGVSVAFMGFAGILQMGVRDLLIYGAGWSLLGVGIAAAALAISNNFGNIKQEFLGLQKSFIAPLNDAKLIAEAFFQLLEHPHHIDATLWKDLSLNGMGVIVKNIAALQWNIQHLFEGMSKGFGSTIEPILSKFTGEGGILETIFGKKSFQQNIEGFLKQLNNNDFKAFGETIGKNIAGAVNTLADAFQKAAPFIKMVFDALQYGFNFLKTANPSQLNLVGQTVSNIPGLGGVGAGMQALAVGKEETSKDNYVQKSLFAAQLSGPYADLLNGLIGVESIKDGLGSKNYLQVGAGALQGGAGIAKVLEAFKNNTSLDKMGITAQYVYVNGQPVDSPGNRQGGSGVGGFLHGMLDFAAKMYHIIGNISAVGFAITLLSKAPWIRDLAHIDKIAKVGGWMRDIEPTPWILKNLAGAGKTGLNFVRGGGGPGIGAVAGTLGIAGLMAAIFGVDSAALAMHPHNSISSTGVMADPVMGAGLVIGTWISRMFLGDQGKTSLDKVNDHWNTLLLDYFDNLMGKMKSTTPDSPGNSGGNGPAYGVTPKPNPQLNYSDNENLSGFGNVISTGGLTKEARADAAAAGKRFGIDPKLILAEYFKESGFGTANPKADSFWKMGLISGPNAYHYGYNAKANTLSEAMMVDASMWSSDVAAMTKKGIPVNMKSLLAYHENYYTPVGAANDPQGLNKNAMRNMEAAIRSLSLEDKDIHIHTSIDGKEVAHATYRHLTKKQKEDAAAKLGQGFANSRMQTMPGGSR